MPIEGYADADFGSNSLDRKSVTGLIIEVFGNVIHWATRKQNIVATSSTEIEYIALSITVSKCLGIKALMKNLNLEIPTCPIFEDNRSAIFISKASENPKQTKHIDVRYHFIRDY